MKNNFFYTIALLITLSACEGFDLENQGYRLQTLPESVSFDGSGDAINADVSSEEGTEVELLVEAPAGTLANIIVTYSLGGTATFGEDYLIPGATTSGGTVTIEHKPSDINNFDNGTISVELVADQAADETNETIVITLVSATRDGESVAVGRGGTDYGKIATVTIENVP